MSPRVSWYREPGDYDRPEVRRLSNRSRTEPLGHRAGHVERQGEPDVIR
jgi:hypothetical protein